MSGARKVQSSASTIGRSFQETGKSFVAVQVEITTVAASKQRSDITNN